MDFGGFSMNISFLILLLCWDSGVLALKNHSEREFFNDNSSERFNGPKPRAINAVFLNKNTDTVETKKNSANWKNATSLFLLNFSQSLDSILQIVHKLENKVCKNHIQLVLDELRKNKKWASQMFDSIPKSPLGLLYGNFYQLGNFDECISVKYPENENSTILGQYCLSDVSLELDKNEKDFLFENDSSNRRSKFNTTRIHWGICLPSACLPDDVAILAKELLTSVIGNMIKFNMVVEKKNCYYQKALDTTRGDIIYGCVIALFVFFIASATLWHVWHMKKRKKYATYSIDTLRTQNSSRANEILFSFSLIRTVRKFLHAKPNEMNLECVCGIKFMSMCFIIFGHSLIFIFGGPIANANFFDEESVGLENGMFLNNPLLVDTFLLVSGFLLCRLLLLELDKRNGKVNFLFLYVARYIRLTPAYVVVIGFYLTWLPKIADGPLWRDVAETEHHRCLKSWWTNLLYINNYVKTDSLCMFQSWYLAVDYHLFIIAPFLIYPLWKWDKTGTLLLTSSMLGAAALPFYITLKDNLDPTLLAFPPEIQDLSTNFYFVHAYIKTHMRASSYFLGLLVGYTVHKMQANGTKIPQLIIWTGWVLASTFGIGSMVSIVIFYRPNYVHDSLGAALYASLHRIAWCFSVGWVIALCVTDNAAVINRFLSWKPFVPASRLTYCAYLVNGLVEIYNRGTVREPLFLSKFELACRLLGHAVLTFSMAFFLCICFESPIHGLEKILLRKEEAKNTQNQASAINAMEENT